MPQPHLFVAPAGSTGWSRLPDRRGQAGPTAPTGADAWDRLRELIGWSSPRIGKDFLAAPVHLGPVLPLVERKTSPITRTSRSLGTSHELRPACLALALSLSRFVGGVPADELGHRQQAHRQHRF